MVESTRKFPAWFWKIRVGNDDKLLLTDGPLFESLGRAHFDLGQALVLDSPARDAIRNRRIDSPPGSSVTNNVATANGAAADDRFVGVHKNYFR